MAAVLGVPVSAAAYGFLALVSYLQKELFTHLPHGLGFATVPAWWPLPMLLVGGVLTALAIRYLPGGGGPSPAGGFAMHPPPTAGRSCPASSLAALATLAFGAVLGPEMPLIALGGGLAALVTRLRRRRQVPDAGGAGARRRPAASRRSARCSGSPLTGAFLLMEASGLGGPTLGLVLLPGLLASGVGALIFIGLDSLTGLGTFALAMPDLPHFSRPNVAEFGWAIVIGLAAARDRPGHPPARAVPARLRHQAAPARARRWRARWSRCSRSSTPRRPASPRPTCSSPGRTPCARSFEHAASYSVGALLLLVVCKGLAYGVSLSSFRGGPIFPALFIGDRRRDRAVPPARSAAGGRGRHGHRRDERGDAQAAADLGPARQPAAGLGRGGRHAAGDRGGGRRLCR